MRRGRHAGSLVDVLVGHRDAEQRMLACPPSPPARRRARRSAPGFSVTVRKALSLGSIASIRASIALASSTGDSFLRGDQPAGLGDGEDVRDGVIAGIGPFCAPAAFLAVRAAAFLPAGAGYLLAGAGARLSRRAGAAPSCGLGGGLLAGGGRGLARRAAAAAGRAATGVAGGGRRSKYERHVVGQRPVARDQWRSTRRPAARPGPGPPSARDSARVRRARAEAASPPG